MKDEEKPKVEGQAEFKAIPKHIDFKLIGDAGESEWYNSSASEALFVNICGRRIVFKNVKFQIIDTDNKETYWFNVNGDKDSKPTVYDYLTDEEISWQKRFLRMTCVSYDEQGIAQTNVIKVYSNETLIEE
tara:strand:- start:1462 stop:1854 length:393 start_codon:yes stop_codon:yes gene_type:complete